MQSQQKAANDLPALAVALEHSALSNNPKVLCAAARVCKAWREAVQQCSACNTDVTIDLSKGLLCFVSFSEWLCKHSALVRSISVCAADLNHTIHGLQQKVHYTAAQQLLQQSIQLATQAPISAGTEQAAAAAAQQQQPQYGLRLASFSSSCFEKPGAVGVLAALPAHSLTHLDLTIQSAITINGTAVSAALARLTCLQEMHLKSRRFFQARGVGCLANVVQLRQLTSLKLDDISWCRSETAMHQLLVKPLPLQQLHLHTYRLGNLAPLDLRGMSQLVDLAFTGCQLDEGLVLPTQLQELHLEAERPQITSAIMPLQQLQRLTLLQGFSEQQQLLQLAQLPALQHLTLCYRKAKAAVQAAASWAKLPQLRALCIAHDDESAMPHQFAATLAGVAACSRLVKLQLTVAEVIVVQADDGYEEDFIVWGAVAACGKLTGLSTLRDLCLDDMSQITPGDARALTALTGLTRLVLNGLHDGVGDVAATALACSLRELQHLDLQSCSLGAMICLAAVGQLTQLTEL